MKIVRFGADQILSGKGGTYTDEDIDALIAKGEERTSAMQAKLETDAKHSLADFSLLGDDEVGTDTFSFGGKNYRDSSGPVSNLNLCTCLVLKSRSGFFILNLYDIFAAPKLIR